MSTHKNSRALIRSKSFALIEKTQERIRKIDHANFPTKFSCEAVTLLSDALDSLAQTKEPPSPEVLYEKLINIQRFVELVEDSTSTHISWPLVSHCDHIWENFFPNNDNVHIFYSLTKTHNYEILNFGAALEYELKDLLNEKERSKIFKDTKLYCLLLAALEDDNLPLYANIGHEFGHALLESQPHLQEILISYCEKINEKIFSALPSTLENRETHKCRIQEIIRGFASELFADLIGALISGPSFLLSFHEMCWKPSDTQYMWKAGDDKIHPSDRFRLFKISENIAMEKAAKLDLFEFPFPLDDLLPNVELNTEAETVSVTTKHCNINPNLIADVLTAQLNDLKKVFDEFLSHCKNEFIPKFKLLLISESNVKALLERLGNNILPNIIPADSSLLGIPASFTEILNAAAFRRINLMFHREQHNNINIYDELQRLEHLTAKAFEVSYIQRQFNEWKKGQQYERT